MRFLFLVCFLCSAWSLSLASASDEVRHEFLQQHCTDCHSGENAEGGFTVEEVLGQDPLRHMSRWVRVYDRVQSGEMPPADSRVATSQEVERFTTELGEWLATEQRKDFRTRGRVRGRRLTKLQLERTLHDVLGVDIPLANQLPDEPKISGFSTVADGQAMSSFQLERHLAVIDIALEEAFRRATADESDQRSRDFTAHQVARRNPRRRTREPELIDGLAVTWAGRVIFYGRLPATTAPEDGWYRFTIRAKGLKLPETGGVWCTVRSGLCVSSAPLLSWVGAFEAREELQEWTFETWLPKGHMLEVRPGDATLRQARFRGGQIGTGEGGPQNVAGVGIESVRMARIHRGPGNATIRTRLLGDVDAKGPVTDATQAAVCEQIKSFAELAFRRPVGNATVQPYVDLSQEVLQDSQDPIAALRAGYRALLCSPRFLYFQEPVGELDDFAIASRLSYLLWGRMPDARLRKLARQGKLQKKEVIRREVERLLSDPRGKDFVRDFASEWLDLSLIDFTEPDRRMYPDFDMIVQHSMLEETHRYLMTMLHEDLSVSHLVDSDFTFLNSRLARFYEIDRVDGEGFQRTSLKADDHRGGLLTQGAILKVTANGTTTSPVVRGVWISERILGVHVPPPPDSVPAIEPDIRGARTIREMLTKHRSDASCAACHRVIDPPGFALENFDPAGQYRTHYFTRVNGRTRPGHEVDASYVLADGTEFDSLRQFQEAVLRDTNALARNVVEKVLTYGTGAPVAFADRESVEKILATAEGQEYGFRSLILAVTTSQPFLTK